MTPDYQSKIDELYAWMLERKKQQISMPLDLASQNLIAGNVSDVGAGSTTLTQTYTDSHGDTVTAPRHFTGTEILKVNGVNREFPYIA